jgi:hypothetical protein
VDHPHHAGLWFNFGNVNGFDFWNNSDAIKPEDREKMGTIHPERVVSAKSGPTRGELVVETVWTTGKGQDLLKETTHFVFQHRADANIIDRETTLTALDRAVFHDDKEGMLGMRVAHFLESADEKGGLFLDAYGRPTKVENTDTTGATGVYLTSEGKQGGAAWGTRGRWCMLTGKTSDQPVTVVIQPTGTLVVMASLPPMRWETASLIPRPQYTTSLSRRGLVQPFVIVSSSMLVRKRKKKPTMRAGNSRQNTNRGEKSFRFAAFASRRATCISMQVALRFSDDI